MVAVAPELPPCGPSRRRRSSGRRPARPPAAKITSAVSAASWRPASDAPACTMTGQPWIGRAMLSGPRTDKCAPCD